MVLLTKPFKSVVVDEELLITEGDTVKFESVLDEEVKGVVFKIMAKNLVLHTTGSISTENWGYDAIKDGTIKIVEKRQ